MKEEGGHEEAGRTRKSRGVIRKPPSKRLFSYEIRPIYCYTFYKIKGQLYMGKKLCGRKIVKVYNYAKDLGMRVEAHGVRIAFGGKGGVTMNSGLCASLTRILAELAKIMHGFLTQYP